MADYISSLPIELVHGILSYVGPSAVAAFSQTSKAAYSAVYGTETQHLWRSLYLAYPLDDPCVVAQERLDAGLQTVTQPNDSVGWMRRTQDVFVAERCARSTSQSFSETESQLPTNALAVLPTFAMLHVELRPARKDSDGEPRRSLTARWIDKTLSSSKLFEDPAVDQTPEPHQWPNIPQLRVCLSRTFRRMQRKDLKAQALIDRRTNSRAYVYDLQNYWSGTNWGPFYMAKGGVCLADWAHIEHLLNVVWFNVCEFEAPQPPCGMEATRAFSAPDTAFTAEDWAGVQGTLNVWCIQLRKLTSEKDPGVDMCALWTIGGYLPTYCLVFRILMLPRQPIQ